MHVILQKVVLAFVISLLFAAVGCDYATGIRAKGLPDAATRTEGAEDDPALPTSEDHSGSDAGIVPCVENRDSVGDAQNTPSNIVSLPSHQPNNQPSNDPPLTAATKMQMQYNWQEPLSETPNGSQQTVNIHEDRKPIQQQIYKN